MNIFVLCIFIRYFFLYSAVHLATMVFIKSFVIYPWEDETH